MNLFYKKFLNLSDNNLLDRIDRKESYQKEAVEAAYQILVERGYSLEYPFIEETQQELEKSSTLPQKDWKALEYHLVFKKFFPRISLIRLLLFGIIFSVYLVILNGGIVDSYVYRKIHLFTELVYGLGSISYSINLLIVYLFFFFRNSSLNKLRSFDNKKFLFGLKTFLILFSIISIWELLLSDYFTFYDVFKNNSYRVFIKDFWFGIFVAFTEEFIFKWILLVQVLVRIPETKQARITAFIIIGLIFSASHIPIQLSKYDSIQYVHLIQTFLFSYFSSVIFVRTRNFPLVVFLHFMINISKIMIDGDSSFYFNWCLIIVMIYSHPSISGYKLFKVKSRNYGPKWLYSIPFLISLIAVFFIPKQDLDYFYISKSYYEIGEHESAMIAIDKAVNMSNGNSKYYNQKGNIHFDYQEYDSAFAYYNKAIESNSKFYGAIKNRGLTCKYLKKYDQGIKDLSVALDKGLSSARIYQYRGDCFSGLKKYEDAISDFHKSLTIDPNNSITLYELGVAFNYLKEYDSCLTYLEMAIIIEPDMVNSYEMIAYAYTGLEQYDTSTFIMTKAIEMGSTNPIRFYIRGINYYKKEDYRRAITEFEKTLQFDQLFDNLYAYLGYSYFYLNNYDIGCEFIKMASDSGDEEALVFLENNCN